MRAFGAAFAALALLAAGPSPSPSAVATGEAASVTVMCGHTPFFVFPPGSTVPRRAATPQARLGQRFELVDARATLSSVELVETNVTVVEPGYAPGSHYWLLRTCVSVSR